MLVGVDRSKCECIRRTSGKWNILYDENDIEEECKKLRGEQ